MTKSRRRSDKADLTSVLIDDIPDQNRKRHRGDPIKTLPSTRIAPIATTAETAKTNAQ